MNAIAENPFKGMGKVFPHTALSESVSWLYDVAILRLDQALGDAFEEIQGKKVLFPNFVIYTVDKALNAAAWHVQPFGCAIAISASTPPLLMMACMQFANRCDVRTALPITDNGLLVVLENKPLIKTKLTNEIRTEKQLLSVLEPFAAAEGMNNSMGLLLCELALKFIAMHECMHVILGHTKYSHEYCNMKSFIEFHKSRKIEPEYSRMLEFIADRHTIRGLWMRLVKRDFDDFYNERLLSGISINEDVYLLRCLVNAMCILSHFLPGNNKSIYAQNSSHPHPYVRVRWMCNELSQELGGMVPGIYEPLNAFTWAAAHLSSNFNLPCNWKKASKEDFDRKTGASYSDDSYRAVLIKAKEWQRMLMKMYGPLYPSVVTN